MFSRQAAGWENVSVVPERYIADGDTIVAPYERSGTARETGSSVAIDGVHVFDFEDGTGARWTSYPDTAFFNAALEP